MVKTDITVQLGLFFLTDSSGCTEVSCTPVPAQQLAVGFLLAVPRLTETSK